MHDSIMTCAVFDWLVVSSIANDVDPKLRPRKLKLVDVNNSTFKAFRLPEENLDTVALKPNASTNTSPHQSNWYLFL